MKELIVLGISILSFALFAADDFENFSKFSKPNHFYVVSNRVEVKRIFRF